MGSVFQHIISLSSARGCGRGTSGRVAILVAVVMWSWGGLFADADPVTDKMVAHLSGRRVAVFDPSGQPVELDLSAGGQYVLGINTQGLKTIGNDVVLYFDDFRRSEQSCRYITFHIDPAVSDNTDVPVPSTSNNLIRRTFTVPDVSLYREMGVLRLFMRYGKPGVSHPLFAIRYYNVADDTPDAARAVALAPPSKPIPVNVGWLGVLAPDDEVKLTIAEFTQRFLFATKGHAGLNVTNLGRKPLPADGSTVAGTVHDYLKWWGGVSHDVEGTQLAALDPAVPKDFEYIKLVWYEEAGGHPQFVKDVALLFPSGGVRTIVFVEAWGGSGTTIALAPYYSTPVFKEKKKGVDRYGRDQTFGPLTSDNRHTVALHELGHLFGLEHPKEIQTPPLSAWEVSYAMECAERGANVMRTGLITGYPTDRLYADDAIAKIKGSPWDDVAAPVMGIPLVDPVGDPVVSATLTLKGKKTPGAGIVVGTSVVVAPGPAGSWTATVAVSTGVNRLDVAETKDGRTGHPVILYVTRLATPALPAIPVVELTNLQPSGTTTVGTIIQFGIKASAASGLRAVWWWVEKEKASGGPWELVPDMGHWRALYGAVNSELKYGTSLAEPGTYRVRTRARDELYPVPGVEHQSNIAEFTVKISP